ncbi:sensor histidine kinase [Ottowia testudinis]|uniref:histidine kinase n=1 Tax=Ottowia testudinis TaxID=2816950 RepID=A0A975H2R8_9BURK|nr:ATP-binding protein [Ottowia testudinis]QTD44491.1 two-component sensor histidine kinase [Ottowia testudinis]
MDGFKKRLSESVQFKLSVVLSLAILLVAVAAGIFSFVAAFDEANELQDDVLRQVAALLDRQPGPLAPSLAQSQAKDADPESRVIVQPLGAVDHPGALPWPPALANGLHTLDVAGQTLRVLVMTTAVGERVAVAQQTALRDEIARDSALRTVMPLLILVPVLLLMVAHLVRQLFRPIAALSADIDQRAERALHPVSQQHLPTEVRPFVVAINRLLARVDESMHTQRRFVADAAHELRSPLTALSLQAERLAKAEMSDPARERLATLRQGIERGRGLMDQLLALASAQSAPQRPSAALSVQAIYRRVLEDLLPLAQARQIDLGVADAQDAQVWANALDLLTVVKNLVDNAIRYTPAGGRVDLSVTPRQTHAVLTIQDSGPGIAPEERERVFDPFYRSLGSDQVGAGLGLAIVKAVADRMGARVHLGWVDEAQGTGLRVCVVLPLASA